MRSLRDRMATHRDLAAAEARPAPPLPAPPQPGGPGLRERLLRGGRVLGNPVAGRASISSFDPDEDLQAAPARSLDPKRIAHEVTARIPGLSVIETDLGPALMHHETYFGHSPLERELLGELFELDTHCFAPLEAPSGPRLPLAESVILDLETTGLAGGTGTGVVILGLARPVPGGVAVAQFLVASPVGEPAALLAADNWAAGLLDGALLTYNGASFDVPILTARGVMARRIPALLARPHIDLLRPARRLWKWRLESHRLQEIERHILGLHRPDDLPGGEIPALYFDVLRTGRWERMTPVLRHNADDLVGLALAAAAIARNARGDCETPAEWLALALALERHGDRAACVSWLRRVVTEAAGEPCWEEAAWRLAIHERRSGNYGRARNLWEALASRPGIRQSAALIALAKLAEWQERDPVTALRLTERILVLGAGVQAPDVRRRQQRLARKAAARPPASLPA